MVGAGDIGLWVPRLEPGGMQAMKEDAILICFG
jgi:hypothetical protein